MSMCNQRTGERHAPAGNLLQRELYGRNRNANFRKPVPSCLVIFRLYYASKLEPSQDI